MGNGFPDSNPPYFSPSFVRKGPDFPPLVGIDVDLGPPLFPRTPSWSVPTLPFPSNLGPLPSPWVDVEGGWTSFDTLPKGPSPETRSHRRKGFVGEGRSGIEGEGVEGEGRSGKEWEGVGRRGKEWD
eukprot:scaffold285_cov330-Pavlova_lutheri.AAC.12